MIENEGLGGGSTGGSPRVLDTPQPGSLQSGVGLISGWVCDADIVGIMIDDQPALPAAYGTTRADTISACGDDNNGFGLTFNWNAVGDGEHRLRAFADGEQFADVTFTVTTLGLGEFPLLEDRPSSIGSVVSFLPQPQSDVRVLLQWQDSKQNFVVKGTIPSGRDEALCCLPQSGQATDPNGISALFSLSNICSVSGQTGQFGVENPIQSSQLAAKADEPFEFCVADLNFEQAAMELLLGDFQVLDGQGNEIICQEIAPGQRHTFTVSVEERSSFTFREPTRVLFNETEVIEIGVVCGDGQLTPSEQCEADNLRGATCQSQGFDGGSLSCNADCSLNTAECFEDAPVLFVSPTLINVGTVLVGEGASFSYLVQNVGTGTLNATVLNTGTGSGFNVTPLGPNQTAQINTGFGCGSTGPVNFFHRITSNGGNADVQIIGTCLGSLCGNRILEPGEACDPPGGSCGTISPLVGGGGTCNANCTACNTFG